MFSSRQKEYTFFIQKSIPQKECFLRLKEWDTRLHGKSGINALLATLQNSSKNYSGMPLDKKEHRANFPAFSILLIYVSEIRFIFCTLHMWYG